MFEKPRSRFTAALFGGVCVSLLLVGTTNAEAGPVPISDRAGPSAVIETGTCWTTGCSLTLSTHSGSHGNQVGLVVHGYRAFLSYFAFVWKAGLHPRLVASGNLDGAGDAPTRFTVPSDPAGKYIVFVNDTSVDNQSTGFEITHLVASPDAGRSGNVTHVSGQGFRAGKTITFRIGGKNASTSAACVVGRHGNFSGCSVRVPRVTSGAHTLVATDGRFVARVPFDV